jgi:hypothetical protein
MPPASTIFFLLVSAAMPFSAVHNKYFDPLPKFWK